jgi:putative flavoprotein involved in K+ transport
MVLLSPAVPGTDWTSLTLQHPIWAMKSVKRPFPSREDFLCYIEAFAREHALNVAENTAATRVTVKPDGFIVSTTEGEKSCRFLVMASGASIEPAFPDIPGIKGNHRVVHSCDFVHCAAYAGKRVLIVGGGNSAAEIAIELAGTAMVTMCTRGPVRYFSQTGNLEHIRGASESVLRELFRFGIVILRENDPVISISDRKVGYFRGHEQEYDWIVCATGYRPKWVPLQGGNLMADRDGYPVISNVGETSIPGLYACGSLARFNRRCAFIHGFRNYIEKIFWDIADRM